MVGALFKKFSHFLYRPRIHFDMLVQSPVYFGTVSVVFDGTLVINSSVCPDDDEISVNLGQYTTRNFYIQVTKKKLF